MRALFITWGPFPFSVLTLPIGMPTTDAAMPGVRPSGITDLFPVRRVFVLKHDSWFRVFKEGRRIFANRRPSPIYLTAYNGRVYFPGWSGCQFGSGRAVRSVAGFLEGQRRPAVLVRFLFFLGLEDNLALGAVAGNVFLRFLDDFFDGGGRGFFHAVGGFVLGVRVHGEDRRRNVEDPFALLDRLAGHNQGEAVVPLFADRDPGGADLLGVPGRELAEGADVLVQAFEGLVEARERVVMERDLEEVSAVHPFEIDARALVADLADFDFGFRFS